MLIFQGPSSKDARNGWHYSYEYTQKPSDFISKQTDDFSVSQGQIEYVLDAIEKTRI